MPFDRTTYTTMASYKSFVLSEVAKHMKSTQFNGTDLLSAVFDSLKRDGIKTCGQLPDILQGVNDIDATATPPDETTEEQ